MKYTWYAKNFISHYLHNNNKVDMVLICGNQKMDILYVYPLIFSPIRRRLFSLSDYIFSTMKHNLHLI